MGPVCGDDARQLAEALLASALPQRWRHVQGVAAEAARLCDTLAVDGRAVVSAAWLHDIGYAPAAVASGFHPLDGARYLRRTEWDDSVCCLVAHHSDAVRQADAQGLGEQLRAEFLDLPGVARDVLWTADATTGPDGERLSLDERIVEIDRRYGEAHPVALRMHESRDAMAAAIARVTHVIGTHDVATLRSNA